MTHPAWTGITLLTLLAGCSVDAGGNPRPIAVANSDRAGAVTLPLGLDGTRSYVPGFTGVVLSHRWDVIVGEESASIDAPDEVRASILATAPGLYVVRLVVTNQGRQSAPVYVNIGIRDVPRSPVADAGPDQIVTPGSTVTLDGSASRDPNGGGIAYAWRQVSGPLAGLSENDVVQPTFVAPMTQAAFEFALTVTDPGGLQSPEDTVVITVPDAPPTARVVGQTTAAEQESVQLDGTTSDDPNGDPITAYQWTAAGNVRLTFDDATSATPSFTVPAFCGVGEQVTISLVVTANGRASLPATHVIDLIDRFNDAPAADAGPDQTVGRGVLVTLNGAGSLDCNGDLLTHAWAQTAGPGGITLSDAAVASPTFTSPSVVVPTDYDFTLTVSDGRGLDSVDSVRITVLAIDPGPPTDLAFTTAPQTVPESSCSGTVTLQTQGILSLPANVTANTAVTLSASSGTTTLYSDAVCSAVITSVTIVTGTNTADFWFDDPTAGTTTLTATSAGLTSATQIETIFQVGPTQLAFVVQPTTTPVDASIAPVIRVAVQDATGTTDPTATDLVTLALGNNPAAGTLSGLLLQPAENGIATFPGLSIDAVGVGYDLVATSGGLTSATSDPFDVTVCTFAADATASQAQAFPWDTIFLDASGTVGCGGTLDYTWTVTAPGGATGGFAPWASPVSTSTQVSVDYYVSEPGLYTFTISVDDGSSTVTQDVTVTVVGWLTLPYGAPNVNTADTRVVTLRPSDGFVFLGPSNATPAVYRRGSTPEITPFGCVSSNKVRTIEVDSTGRVYFGFDDKKELDEITGFDASDCTKVSHDPSGFDSAPGKYRDLVILPNDDIYGVTEKDLFLFDRAAGQFVGEYHFDDFGNDQDLSAAALDHSGDLWVASRNNDPDGLIITALPPVQSAPMIDFFGGSDDKIRGLTRGVFQLGVVNEMFISTDALGLVYVPDVADPVTFVVYAPAGADFDTGRHGETDANGDVWIATKTRLARFKRDVLDWAQLPDGDYGLAAGGEIYDVAHDLGNGRGRTLYLATKGGVHYLRTP